MYPSLAHEDKQMVAGKVFYDRRGFRHSLGGNLREMDP